MAVVDFFLKIDGVDGESTDDKHKGEIDIESFSFGVSQIAHASAGGGGAGKVSLQDIHFAAQVNLASPRLLQACATGEHFKKAVLTCRKAGGQQQEFLKVTLTDVLISGYSIGSNPLDDGFSLKASEDDVPTDQFSLNFRKVQMLYTPSRPDGMLGTTGAGGVDIAVG